MIRMCRTLVLPVGLLALCLTGLEDHTPAHAAQDSEGPFTEEQRNHWAFQAVRRADIPRVEHSERVRNPIDAFLLRRLEQRGLTFSPPASKREFIRRAKFDMLGLPPTPEEVERFLADDSPEAYDRLIERFLASPHYGEMWGRYWLDLVRFAETAGYKSDETRPLAYKYRDYVIRSFNRDKPYNRFVQEQIAGDELFPQSAEAQIATGYLRMWPDESNASDVLLARQDALNDLTSNVGDVFLAMSVGCAQCHNHKFDPILQRDFYELQAFFSGFVLEEKVPLGTAEQLQEYQSQFKQWQAEAEAVRTELHAIEQPAEAEASEVKRRKFPDVVLEAIDTAPWKRTTYQQQLAFWSERQIGVSEEDLLKQMTDEQKQRREELRKRLAELEKEKPEPPKWLRAMAVRDAAEGPAETHLLAGGSYENPMKEVQPAVLSAMEPAEQCRPQTDLPRPGTSGRRSALAKWLTDPDNPLTARVMVNRIWQGHFGKGLVKNANDFGTRTAPPSHPELLDWLATEFIRRGWSIKEMHRLIMTSAAYRQSAYRVPQKESDTRVASLEEIPVAAQSPRVATRGLEEDPDNTLYWHSPRRRLTAEQLRDAILFVAGKLNDRMYGPGVKPDLPENFSTAYSWKPSEDEAARHRRSVYIFAKRNLPYPLLTAFDLPDMHESCARRPETTVAPQALWMMNSRLVFDWARSFAGRVLRAAQSREVPAIVEQAYQLALSRSPDEAELQVGVEFIEAQRSVIAQRLERGEEAARPEDCPDEVEPALGGAVVDFCHALLNANEFLYME